MLPTIAVRQPNWRSDCTLHHKAQNEKMTMDQNLIPSSDYQGVKPTGEIFVVDDDRDVRNMLAAALAPEGFPVTTFEDGDSFMTAARTRVPICVFLDVVLPRRSGLEILKDLREQRFWTPTYLLSARDDTPTVVEAIKNGGHDFIKKPFEIDALVQRVRNAVDLWLCRERDRRALDFDQTENCEWFRLTPSERNLLLLMRLGNK
jgi:two-component system, LuxR family, response regulator FixJ